MPLRFKKVTTIKMDSVINFTRIILVMAGAASLLVSISQANNGKWNKGIYFLVLSGILWSL